MRLAALVLAHLMYDFHWQGPFIAEMKGKNWFLLGVHALTWALTMWVVAGLFAPVALWQLAQLFIVHFIVDAWKARYTKLPSLGAGLWIDQSFHAAQIALLLLF